MSEWGKNVIGKHGTIVAAKDLKPGNIIVLLERQIDLGNDTLVTLANVTNHKSLVTLEGRTDGREWYRRCGKNTLVFLFDAN